MWNNLNYIKTHVRPTEFPQMLSQLVKFVNKEFQIEQYFCSQNVNH